MAATRPDVAKTTEAETQETKNRAEIPHGAVEEESGPIECPQGASHLILPINEHAEVAKQKGGKEAITYGTLRKIVRQENARAIQNAIIGRNTEELDPGSDRSI